MKTHQNLVDERFRNIKVKDNTTIQNLYEVAYAEVGEKYAGTDMNILREDIKFKVRVPQFYKKLLYTSKKSLTMSDELFECVYILLGKGFMLADSCKYRGSTPLDTLKLLVTELNILEAILKTIFGDNHTDKDLQDMMITEKYLAQTRINKRNRTKKAEQIKNLKKAILGYTGGSDLDGSGDIIDD